MLLASLTITGKSEKYPYKPGSRSLIASWYHQVNLNDSSQSWLIVVTLLGQPLEAAVHRRHSVMIVIQGNWGGAAHRHIQLVTIHFPAAHAYLFNAALNSEKMRMSRVITLVWIHDLPHWRQICTSPKEQIKPEKCQQQESFFYFFFFFLGGQCKEDICVKCLNVVCHCFSSPAREQR